MEQVRFLRELERSAVDSALNAIDLPGNVLGKLVTFNDMATGKSVAVFNLNGQQHRVTIPRKLGFDVTPQYAAQAALEALSEEIAKAILKEIPK